MHNVTLKLQFQSSEYETETQEWTKLPEDQLTRGAWETTQREANFAKRRAEVAQEGEEKPFGGSAIFGAAPANKPLWRQEHQKTAEPDLLKNHMMDSL